MAIIPEKSNFDVAFILSSVFLWIIFGFFQTSISCDLQYLINNFKTFKHLLGIVSIFFLFSVIGNKPKEHISIIWIKTILIYCLFVLLSKSKWYFSLTVIVLLLVDQSIKLQEKHNIENKIKYNEKAYDLTRNIISYIIYALVVIGVGHGLITDYQKDKMNFSLKEKLFGFGCDDNQISPSFSSSPSVPVSVTPLKKQMALPNYPMQAPAPAPVPMQAPIGTAN